MESSSHKTDTNQAMQAQLDLCQREVEELREALVIAHEREKAAQERVAELEKANEALRNAIAGLARLDNLDHFLVEMLRVAIEISGAQGGTVVLIDGDVLRLPVLFTKQGLVDPYTQECNGHLCIPFSPELREYARRISKSEEFWMVEPDDLVHPPSFRTFHQEEGNRAISHVPMRIGARLLGWLGLGFAEKDPPLGRSYALLSVLAEQMTMAIELLRLAKEAKQAAIAREQEKAAQERAAELEKANEALARTTVRLTEQGDLTRFFDELLLETSRQLEADSAHLVVYDNKQRRYSTLHQHNGNVKREPELPVSFSLDEMQPENFHTIAQRERHPHWYDAQADAALFSPGAGAFLSRAGLRSVLHVPLIVGEQIVGGIGFAFRDPHPKGSQRPVLVEALAHQAALAIQLIQLAEQAQQAAILAERNRMAGEIHDSLAQSFIGVLMQLHVADSFLVSQPDQAQDCITRAQSLAKEGLTEARLSVWSLCQENTDYCFIADTLSRIVQQLTTGTSIQAMVHTQGTPYCLQAEVGMNLLRIAQESLTNSLRHAQADTIEVHLTYAPDYMQLCVRDNGRGFEPQHHRSGFGLISIQQRAERIGAQLRLDSQPEAGTVITLTVPVHSP
jgi:signal transduction histidine kinase